MQINNVVNLQNIQRQQNFKGSSANSSVENKAPNYQTVPLNVSKAYASPQIAEGFKEIETFDVPYIGKGKLYELTNGHKVIILPKASKTYISTTISAGLLDEPADKKDIAHLTEHLLANYWLKASQTSDIAKILMETGAYSNASTGNYTSSYHMSANIKDNSDLEGIMMLQLATLKNNNFTEAEIQKEKNIIIEENKEKGYLVDDKMSAENQTIKNLFSLNALNKITAEKTIPKIENIGKEDLESFYNNFYRPDNMTTIIVGNVDYKSIKIISKYLNKMNNPKSNIERKNLTEINKENYINQFKRSDIESKDKSNKYNYFANLSFIGPAISNPKDTESSMILNKIIKNRLKEQNINVDIEIPSISSDKNIPQIICIRSHAKKDTLANNTEIIYSTINDIRKNSVSKEELTKAKEQFLEELSDKLEDNESLAYLLKDLLASDININMNIKSLTEHFNNINVTDIQNIAQKYFDLNKSSLVVVHPNKNIVPINKGVSFKGLPELTNEKDIKEYDLPNNLHVVFDSRPGIFKTAVSCSFLYEDQQNNNSGMIEVLNSSLTRDNNAEFPAGNWIQPDGIFIRKYGSIHNLQNILNDIKQDLISPKFDKEKLEEYKQFQQKHLSEITNNRNTTVNKLQLLEYQNFQETRNKIIPNDITEGSLKVYYNRLLKTSQGTIIITLPQEELHKFEPKIIKTLAEIPSVRSQNFSRIESQFNPKIIEKKLVFLNKDEIDDKVQIEKNFKIIHNGVIKDEAGIMLLNEILNYELKSLRDDLDLTYGAYSRFDKCGYKHGILTIFTETAKTPLQESTKNAVNQIDKIINDLMNSKVNEYVLNSIKKQTKLKLLTPAETSVDRNMNLESSYEKSFDIYHSQKLAEAFDDITIDDLQKLAQKYLTTNYLLEISGNKEAIDANDEYLSNLGKITIQS